MGVIFKKAWHFENKKIWLNDVKYVRNDHNTILIQCDTWNCPTFYKNELLLNY